MMTVLATILAGLSSGEMSRAQYYRSLAAQTQAKAGDQWAFYQAKRLRGALAEHTLDLLVNSSRPARFDPADTSRAIGVFAARLQAVPIGERGDRLQAIQGEVAALRQNLDSLLADAQARKVLGTLATLDPPRIAETPIASSELRSLVDAIAVQKPEDQTQELVRKLDEETLRRAIQDVEAVAATFDEAVKPVQLAIAKARTIVARLSETGAQAERSVKTFDVSEAFRANTDFAAARLHYEAARYEAESGINLRIGRLYEASVRRYGFISDRHRVRSTRFFYGMLSAQAAVTIATLALATRERNLFWGLATAVGLAAITFGAYVYVFI
ncbi:MAG: DUF4337 family protein [Tepidisphaerales bacterium]